MHDTGDRDPSLHTPPPALAGHDPIEAVVARLAWMERERIWPSGVRYLWTDGFGVVLLCSLADALDDMSYLDLAEEVVLEVDRVLRRPRGYRIGEAPDRGGQYFHYLMVWAFALGVLGARRPGHHERAIELVREVHPRFVRPGAGIVWKMREDLSEPAPGFGWGALDPFHALAVYRCLDGASGVLASEIDDVRALVDASWRGLHIGQDLGLGMMLWCAARCADDDWSEPHIRRGLEELDALWVDPPGYFMRGVAEPAVRFAFTNYGIVLGLRSVHERTDRIDRLLAYFDAYRSHDHYDRDAITHVMGCTARLPDAWLAPHGRERGAPPATP